MKIYKTIKIDGDKAKNQIVVANSKRDKRFKELFNNSDIIEDITPSEEALKELLNSKKIDEHVTEFIVKSCFERK